MIDEAATLPDSAALRLPMAETPSRSGRAAAEKLGMPLLVTTADHALLMPQWVDHFIDHLPDASLVAALARRESVLDAVPEAHRTFMKFADGSYSGCNLFFLRDAGALAVIDVWQRVEEHRKNPARLFGILGAKAVTAYLLGRLTLADALEHLSARAEARCAVVEMPFGESAVDVDKPADIELARRIMAARSAEVS